MTRAARTSRRDLMKSAATAVGTFAAAARFSSSDAQGQEIDMSASINAMAPTPEQISEFLALPDGPIVMVNLLKFKPDGGREEYAEYGRKIAPILERIGARVLFSGDAKVCLIGNADWDAVALVEYPTKTALIEMSRSEEYQAIHHHRAAGLEGQVNYAVAQNAGLR